MSIPPRITPQNALEAIRHLNWTRAIMRPPAIGFRNLKEEVQGNNAVSHQEFVAKYLANLTLTWESIEDVRRQWDGPLYIKSILTPEDHLRALNARGDATTEDACNWYAHINTKRIHNPEDAQRAHKAGADGIYVSNHGRRQLDSSPSSIRALPRIADAVGDRMTVIFDSGVRTGDDIVKALAVGADLVSIGRAWGYGNAAAGEKGVLRVLDILDGELSLAMGQLGATRINALDRSFVEYPEAWHGQGIHREPEPTAVTEEVTP